MVQIKEEKRAMYRRIFVITLPIVLQNLLSAAVNSADVVMLNYVGSSSLSAGSLASQYMSIAFMIYYGLGTGVSMLSAQYWGKGDVGAIHKVEGIALRFSTIISTLFLLCCSFLPTKMMKIFTNDQVLIEIGADYLRIVGISFIFWGFVSIYEAVLRSVGRVKICTLIDGVALGLNVLLNAVFIFGLFGLPQMGIRGVALATTISRGVALVICIVVSLCSKDVKIVIQPIFHRHPGLFKDFLTMSIPALGNDIIWSVGFSMYSVILGHLGDDVVAANAIVSVVRNLGSVFCFAIGSATGIILGQMLGENRKEEAKTMSHILLRLSFITGILGGLIVFAITPFALHYANITETAKNYLKFMLLINTYYITGSAVNTTLIAGTFRAGGDSRFGFICDTVDMWGYAIPLGFLAAFVLKLPIQVVYFLLCTDEFVKWPWVFKHYYSYKWAKNITRDKVV
ncbi:MAG: MATE family efflux transporter [Clostridiales bacterium]|nr:MATE family efflux transporter [Clostridiales bacterium]